MAVWRRDTVHPPRRRWDGHGLTPCDAAKGVASNRAVSRLPFVHRQIDELGGEVTGGGYRKSLSSGGRGFSPGVSACYQVPSAPESKPQARRHRIANKGNKNNP